jgi:glycosyltransferase involved in cell wall biosynthesis
MTASAESERLQPGVTVIIPTLNRQALLLRTLHSVLAQTGVQLFVVVVDDGGDDGTDDAVQALGDPRLLLIRHETRRGVSAARNSGLAVATTEWVAFVDDDDLWAPDKLECQLAAIAADGSARWSCVGSVNVDAEMNVLWWADPLYERDMSRALLRSNSIPGGGSGVLASTSLSRAIGGFDESMSNLADWDFYLRLAQESSVAAVHAPMVAYLVHSGSMAHNIHRSVAEYAYMKSKYAQLRSARGVELDEAQWLGYLAGMAYNGGRRVTGARMHLNLVIRHGRLRSLRSMGMALMPTRVYRARTHRGAIQVPAVWVQSVSEWLRRYTPPETWRGHPETRVDSTPISTAAERTLTPGASGTG